MHFDHHDYELRHAAAEAILLRPQQVASILGISVKTLANWRVAGSPIPFVKIGTRAIRYRAGDVSAFVAAGITIATSTCTKAARLAPHFARLETLPHTRREDRLPLCRTHVNPSVDKSEDK